MKNAKSKRVSILYIGDSHVQADDFTGELRSRFQLTYGNAGRGMVFPYSTARTHAAVDYTTSHTGRWLNAKNIEINPQFPLGVSGVTSRTLDSNASFRLSFKGTIQPEHRRLRFFLKRDALSYDFTVRSGTNQLFVDVFEPKALSGNTSMLVVDLPMVSSEFVFTLKKTDSAQSMFEIYGISIETPDDAGVLFHSVGINGAGHYSLLRQNLMKEQLEYLKPDAVILDLGANDFYRGKINKEVFSNNLLEIIEIIRKYNPETTVILSCSQDIYRGGYSLPDCLDFSDLIKEFSRRNKCLFYDWYWVSGGRFSMMHWQQNGLANWDMVHLTHAGYLLKGQLMAESYERTAYWLNQQNITESLLYDVDSLRAPLIDTSKKNLNTAQTQVRYQWVYHRVLRGQTIWSVASLYSISAYQIKKWNRLRNNYLRTGQILKIYAPIKVQAPMPVKTTPPAIETGQDSSEMETPEAPQKISPKPPVVQQTEVPKTKPQPKPKPQPAPTKIVYHKVKSGETLFSISKKYGTSTTAIMKLNNMRNYNIRAGQTIRIK
ncbi:MAG: LysM peptidoglycan-binding domain-containing protein [Sphingomonadales bacterium]